VRNPSVNRSRDSAAASSGMRDFSHQDVLGPSWQPRDSPPCSRGALKMNVCGCNGPTGLPLPVAPTTELACLTARTSCLTAGPRLGEML
jgi:hypothetical protein